MDSQDQVDPLVDLSEIDTAALGELPDSVLRQSILRALQVVTEDGQYYAGFKSSV